MGDWQDFPLPDGSYSDATRPWSQQDVCNYLPTFAESEGTRSRLKLATCPGLETFANGGDGPHRAARDVEGRLFVVSGTGLYQVATSGVATLLGTIPGTGRVSMTHNQIANGNELVIGTVDNSYVWNTVTSTLTATGVALQSVDFLNQMALGIEPQRRFWRYSALADATSWNTLDNESAESSPDRIVGGIVSQGEWLVFGERTIEVWRHDPTQGSSFQRGPVIERGCANANTLCRLDNSVFFVDNFGIPCRLDGYTPIPIAPKAIIEEIGRSDPTKLFAFTYEDNGYVIYYLTSQDGKTWGYDVTTRRWHRRESYGMDRWRLNTLFKWNGAWYGGDGFNGKIYRLRWGYVYEGCEIMPRKLRSGVMHSAENRVSIHAFKLVAATGGVPSETQGSPSISGALPDGYIGESVSYQYTLTGDYPGEPLTASIASGSLPTGLTMDENGLVTGTRGAVGAFSWTLATVSEDSCGGTATLADSANVIAVPWLAIGSFTSGEFLASDDGLDWTGTGFRAPADPEYFSPGTGGRIYRHENEIFAIATSLNGGVGRRIAHSTDLGATFASYAYGGDSQGGDSAYLDGKWWFSYGNTNTRTLSAGVVSDSGFQAYSVCTDGEFLYTTDAGNLRKRDASGTILTSSNFVADMSQSHCAFGDGVVGIVKIASAGGGLFQCNLYQSTDEAASLAAISHPMTTTLISGAEPVIHYSSGLGIWVIVFDTQIAYGAALDDLTLSSYTLPFPAKGVGDDGIKVVIAGGSASMVASTDMEAFDVLTVTTGSNTQDAVALAP